MTARRPSSASRRRDITADERALWRRAVRDARPLASVGAAEPPEVPVGQGAVDRAPDIQTRGVQIPPPAAAQPAAQPADRPAPAPLILSDPRSTPGLDRRGAERLSRGALPLDGRLDLHGMSQDEARRALDAFVGAAWERGARRLLVITGKGGRRDDPAQPGVLKANVPRWLGEAPNRGRVLAIAQAQPRHGGAGALYLLLRRRRD